MSSNQPNSPENPSLPARHRLSVEKLRKEALESELWDLDEEQKITATQIDQAINKSGDPVERETHHEPQIWQDAESPADAELGDIYENDPQPYPEPTADPSWPNATDNLAAMPGHEESTLDTTISPEPKSHSIIHDELGELEMMGDWDDEPLSPPQVIPKPIEPPGVFPSKNNDASLMSAHATDEASPLIPTHSTINRRKSSFNLTEMIAMGSVALAILGITGFFLLNALTGLPRQKDPYEQPEMPISATLLTITAINSYWRVPNTTGPNPDTIQRGTELIPVLELTATGNNAALRIQFYNSEGNAVGDPITHIINGETTLVTPSTAGLEDINFHSAYRTGLIDPWTAEILEATAGTTTGSAFRRVIAIPISPNRP